ncbi:MAG: Hsp20/alpha crystallin family protein [Candidatus Bathyarchaeales archaeon]
MSAKWRRSRKNSKWLKAFKEDKDFINIKKHINVRKIKTRKNPYAYKISINLHKTKKWREPKPLIDVFEEENEITVVAGLAGFPRESLKVTVKEQQLIISAEAFDRRYHKSLNLPSQVIPNTLRTTYKNGVLEIRLKKAVEKKVIDKIAGLENAT